jgi:excisionase family DNA binding protein
MSSTDLPDPHLSEELFGELIESPVLVHRISRSTLPAVIIRAAALVERITALQLRIAARLLMEPGEQQQRMVTVEEAAGLLSYREQYIYQLIRDGRLPAKREGRKIRIRWEDLLAYMRQGATKAGAGLKPVHDPGAPDGQTNVSISGNLEGYMQRVRGPRRRRDKRGLLSPTLSPAAQQLTRMPAEESGT